MEHESEPGDYTESDDEGEDSYCRGGYHRVNVGDYFNSGRYRVEAKLGWGHFSTVWLCEDMSVQAHAKAIGRPCAPFFVAMKVQKSAQHYTEAAYDEIELLSEAASHANDAPWMDQVLGYPCPPAWAGPRARIMGFTGVVTLLDYFEHQGPNGTHVCMVFEVMGPNVLALIKQYEFKGVPEHLVRKVAAHTLVGLDYLHRVCGIIHTDLKPENVLISCPWNVPINKQGQPLVDPRKTVGNKEDETSRPKAPEETPEKPGADKGDKQRAVAKAEEDAKAKAEEDAKFEGLTKKQKKNLKQKEKRKAQKAEAKAVKAAEGDRNDDATDEEQHASPSTVKQTPPPSLTAATTPVDLPPLPVKKKPNFPPYVKPFLKPSRSDPSLLSSYGDKYGCWKMPYHQWQAPPQEAAVGGPGQPALQLPTPRPENHWGLGRPEELLPQPTELEYQHLMHRGVEPFSHETTSYKLADLGNACWLNRQFAQEIQTRQYRSPEVILGAGYGPSADMWSFACMIFELITGDYLFDPKTTEEYARDEDHLALTMELLGNIPPNVLARSRMRRTFFNMRSELRHIKTLRYWSLENVLRQKYKQNAVQARTLASFLIPLLCLDPDQRPTAQQQLKHPWVLGLPCDECDEFFPPVAGPTLRMAPDFDDRLAMPAQRDVRALSHDGHGDLPVGAESESDDDAGPGVWRGRAAEEMVEVD